MERIGHGEERRRGGPAVQRRRGAKVALGARERRRLAQLGICLLLFLAVFLTKGLGGLADLRGELAELLGGDADFRSAFAQMGQAFSRGDNVLEALGNFWEDEPEEPKEPEEGPRTPGPFFEAQRTHLLRPVTATGVLQMDLSLSDPIVAQPAPSAPVGTPTPVETPAPVETAAPAEAASPGAAGEESPVSVPEYTGPALPAGTTMEWVPLELDGTVSPIEGAEGWWVSSEFGWREHPVDGEERFHNGVDLAVNTGTAVGAFADGTVDYIGESEIYGLYTQLRHENGVTSFYAHCSELLVQKGQSVSAGETVALSGGTGNATGPHLHFELKKDGVLLNPLYYMEGPGAAGET